MTDKMGTIPVLAAPYFDPGFGRVDVEMPCGLTIQEIVELTLPAVHLAELDRARVILVTPEGMSAIRRGHWLKVKPKPGVRVVIRMVPGKSVWRSVLQIVVGIAAIALGQLWAVPVAGFLGISTGLAAGLIGLGVNMIGNMLINALVPPPKTSNNDKKTNTYTISGWRNPITPDGVVPLVLGEMRFAPPFAAMSYTEIVNDIQYVRAVFCLGYGPLDISGHRIGDTPLQEYQDYEIETRQGYASDPPLFLYPRQVIEDGTAADLTRPLPRDQAGNIISGAGKETPVVRPTAADSDSASVIVSFPAGLFTVNDEGKRRSLSVSLRIRQRHVSSEDWQTVTTLNVSSSKREGFYRQFSWKLPYRGQWQIEITRMTDERAGINDSDRSVLVAVQSIRPEYPLNFDKPLALVALRIKATYQLNGALDAYNVLAKRIGFDWDPATPGWLWRTSRNPASAFRYALTGDANVFPATLDELEVQSIQAWHEYCTDKGLCYDAVLMEDQSLKDTLDQIAAAGRASARHDGMKWGVVVDRPRDLPVIDHINRRNSEQFRWQRTYIDPPHAFRVPFNDRTNDYKPAERVVRWPGYIGDITLTEEIQLPGKTDPREIWLEARRRMYEIIHRPDQYSCIMDGAVRTATRGDLVMGSFDVLSRTQVAGRVVNLLPLMIELDELVTMEAGETYAVRFRRYLDEADTIGVSVVRQVVTYPGTRRTLVFSDESHLPAEGSIVHFGPMSTESMAMIVSGIEAGEDFSSIVHMLDAAPQIDDLIDAEVPPAWSGRVGAEIDGDMPPPAAPVFTAIQTGYAGTGTAGGLYVALTQGNSSATPVATFEVDHRKFGAGTWTTVSFDAAEGGRSIAGYKAADDVQFRARAFGVDGTPSTYTSIVTIRIGENDEALPGTIPASGVSVVGALGYARISFYAPSGADRVQVYKSATGSYDPATGKVGSAISVTPGGNYSIVDGDASRTSLLANGDFSQGSTGWTLGGSGWTFAGNTLSHSGGTPAQISQAVAFDTSKKYRLGYRLSNMSAGNFQPILTGGSNLYFMVPNTTNGFYVETIEPFAGNNRLQFGASNDNVGQIDDIVLFVETPACLPQGVMNYWLEPQNSDGVPGQVVGPFPAMIT